MPPKECLYHLTSPDQVMYSTQDTENLTDFAVVL
jgi:hypothetical protein